MQTNGHLVRILKKGMLIAAFLANPSQCADYDCVDQMWDQYSAQVWKSSCILGDIVALEQWSNHEFTCTRNKRDLAGMFSPMNAEGNFLQVESSSQIS